ncbi:MAG: hypothetical protein LBE95_01980 [Holosporaceae bacterium]|jgi:hypothetical protein|nr:hypothetical protein [Holosporaceae bacterium]
MSQIDLYDKKNLAGAAFLSGCGAFFIFLAMCSPLKLALYFIGLPIFIAYLAYGNKNAGISALALTILLFFSTALEISIDIFLNIIAPAILLGHLSIKNIQMRRKTWWYPETYMLQYLAALSFISVAFLSMAFYSESSLIRNVEDAMNALLKPGDPNAVFLQKYLLSSVKYAVGIGTLIKMLITMLNFGLAHLIAKKIKKNIRPGFDFNHLTIHYSFAIFPLLSLTLAKIFHCLSFVCSGLFVVGLFAPAINGFSAIHRFAKGSMRILIGFYAALLTITLPMAAVVVLIGIISSFQAVSQKTDRA